MGWELTVLCSVWRLDLSFFLPGFIIRRITRPLMKSNTDAMADPVMNNGRDTIQATVPFKAGHPVLVQALSSPSLNSDKAVPPSHNAPEYSFLHPRMNLNNPCHLARMHPSMFPHLFLKCTWVYVLTATTLLANQILLQHPHPWFRQLNNSFYIIQEVHLINSTIVPLHPIVPNPYTILSTIPEPLHSSLSWTLRVPSFSILVGPNSQVLFAFTWTDTLDSPNSSLGLSPPAPQGFRVSLICSARHSLLT